jgi:DNA-binding GntR family transcriptional regulator
LVATIEDRDADRASKVMAQHLDRVRDQMVAALADEPLGNSHAS